MTRSRSLALVLLVACAGVFTFVDDSTGQIRREGARFSRPQQLPAQRQPVPQNVGSPQCSGLGGAGPAATEWLWVHPADFDGTFHPSGWLAAAGDISGTRNQDVDVPLPPGATIQEIIFPVFDDAPDGHITLEVHKREYSYSHTHGPGTTQVGNGHVIDARCASGYRLLEAKGLNLQYGPGSWLRLRVRFQGTAAQQQLQVGGIRIGYTR